MSSLPAQCLRNLARPKGVPRPQVVEDTPANDPITSRTIVDRARYEDIARRLLMQQTPKQIASAHDISERQLRRVMREPEMIQVFERAKEAVFNDLDGLIKNEKAAPLLRARAQMIRAQTLLGNIMTEVQSKMDQGLAKATHLKVGMETAFGIVDRSKSELGIEGGGNGSANVELNISLQQGTASILGDAVRESGVDLSDVLQDIVLEGNRAGNGDLQEGSQTPVQERDQEDPTLRQCAALPETRSPGSDEPPSTCAPGERGDRDDPPAA